MNRFFVFAGETYYPVGGLGDLQATTSTLEDAMKVTTGVGKWGDAIPDWGYIAEYNGVEFEKIRIWNAITKEWIIPLAVED